ncbi:MAG: hypothetical protein FWH28_08835 [Clostridiales bacterium]|nr:hypothetical protein [Clostridiales bacterium]
MKDWKRGIYCQPAAVAATPDFAKRLMEEAGVDHFILRSGPGGIIPDAQEKAVEVLRELNADIEFMVSTFWGGGGPSKPIENLLSKSWESQYLIDLPGSPMDEVLIAKMEKLCKLYKPEAICVTHARYRHPAYLDGIFDEGVDIPEYQARMEAAGIPRSDVIADRALWEKAMGALDSKSLLKAAEKGILSFLCELSQSDAVMRLIRFRQKTVRDSLMAFRKAVTAHDVSFGANAYPTWGAELCGQDYANAYAETCDFVQPLLCYMEWHRYEPIAAWGRYLHLHSKADEAASVEAAKILFGLGNTLCPDRLNALDTCAEGNKESIYSIVSEEIKMCAPYVNKPYQLQLVLRGKEWDWQLTDTLVSESKAIGVDSFIYVGCDYLIKGLPPVVDTGSALTGWS